MNRKRERAGINLHRKYWGLLIVAFSSLIPIWVSYVAEDLTVSLLSGIANIIGFFVGIILMFGAKSKRARNRAKNIAPRISQAPGAKLLSIVEYLYSPKIVEGVFKQIVGDWRTEYFDALKEGRNLKAYWISVRYTFSFVMAMGLSKLFSVIRGIAHK
jgi:hypothetical protein